MSNRAAIAPDRARLRRRHRAERRFRAYGIGAIALGLIFLGAMFATMLLEGWSGFRQSTVTLEIAFDPAILDSGGGRNRDDLARADYQELVKKALRQEFPEAQSRDEKRDLYRLVSSGAGFVLRELTRDDPTVIGTTRRVALPASDDVDMLLKGDVSSKAPAAVRRLNDRQVAWLQTLKQRGSVAIGFNRRFFTGGDSREPELAGVLVALVGSLLSLLVCFALAFPLGMMAAVYLEAFAPRNRWAGLIEININNLAAVPSIVFGLLGLAVFLNLFGLPRSAPLVGGMVLALMTLPTIIIAGRAALKAVPPSIYEAALALGASPVQTVRHHVLPLAMPGMLTGTIIGMARALGETAPLLMIGMVAFIVDVPRSILDPATALPIQIFLWADSPERAFGEKTAAAIIVLLVFLICMNLSAVILRKKFERRW